MIFNIICHIYTSSLLPIVKIFDILEPAWSFYCFEECGLITYLQWKPFLTLGRTSLLFYPHGLIKNDPQVLALFAILLRVLIWCVEEDWTTG